MIRCVCVCLFIVHLSLVARCSLYLLLHFVCFYPGAGFPVPPLVVLYEPVSCNYNCDIAQIFCLRSFYTMLMFAAHIHTFGARLSFCIVVCVFVVPVRVSCSVCISNDSVLALLFAWGGSSSHQETRFLARTHPSAAHTHSIAAEAPGPFRRRGMPGCVPFLKGTWPTCALAPQTCGAQLHLPC